MRRVAIFLALAAALLARPAAAQLTIPASTQFDVTGFIQEATLDPACVANAHCGGTIKVNGHVITVPKETIVIYPANALTWQESFSQAPAPYGMATTPPSTGLAMADLPVPLTTYEGHVIGNRVGDTYIAGLIYVSQQGLNSGAGYINFIDYTLGELRVGGILGNSATGTRVQLNDPVGRFGRVVSPDSRFSVDDANPTIAAGTGFPMCLPRVDPASTTPDALCPQSNRPKDVAGLFLSSFFMNDPRTLAGVPPDATKQAPLEVGDYITFAGTLVKDGASANTTGPWPANGVAGTYVSAHTITNNVAIYTAPGANPAYVGIEVALIGTGGLTVLGAGEAAIRTRFEGMTTDPSRNIHLYGIDFDPKTGGTIDRDWGTIGVDPGPPNGAVMGRWRFRPPCTASVATDKACTPPPGGTFLPAPREVRAVIEGAWTPGQTTAFANGIIAGQFHAPIGEYIFPENIPGTPIVPNNFNAIPFLAAGGYSSSLGTLAGQLSPWPDAVVPTPACTAPQANAGGPYTVAASGTVGLTGSATGTAPITFTWATPTAGSLSATNIANPTFTAPLSSAAPIALALTASNSCGTSTSNTTVTVNVAGAPTVAHVQPLTMFSGAAGSFNVSATDPNGLNVTFTVTQTGTPALSGLTVGTPSCGGTPLVCTSKVSFTAPSLPVGQTTSSTINLTITAKNTANATSAPEFTSVTVNPLPDTVTITATEYRTGKQRLVVNASSSVVSPNVILTLQPYVTTLGTTFDPATLGNTFTNTGGGLYLLTLVGAPQPRDPPAGLVVQSNLGGVSAPHGIDKLRQ